jgi:predicted transcriptional regulator
MHANHQPIPKVVKLAPEIKDRLDQLGKLKHRSAHWLMKEAIVRYLEQEEYSERLKQETLSRWQEAENGKIVSHSAVEKWLDSWGTDEEGDRPPCED